MVSGFLYKIEAAGMVDAEIDGAGYGENVQVPGSRLVEVGWRGSWEWNLVACRVRREPLLRLWNGLLTIHLSMLKLVSALSKLSG
jgi:hypothetical protein